MSTCSIKTSPADGSARDARLSIRAGPVLVVVSAKWCSPCQRLSAFLPVLMRRFVIAVRVLDAGVDRYFISRWSVESLPSLLLFRDGDLVDRTSGFTSYADLARWVGDRTDRREAKGRPGMSEDSAESFAQRAALIDANYEAATLPAAEALGRVLGPAFEQHEALVAELRLACEAGSLAKEAASRLIEQSQQSMQRLGAPELAEQRRVTAAALDRYVEEVRLAAMA